MKYHIEKNTVQETLVIPLYGRKMCSELYPNLYRDETALRLIDQIDYDFRFCPRSPRASCSSSAFWRPPCARTTLHGRCGTICASIRTRRSSTSAADWTTRAAAATTAPARSINLDFPGVIAVRDALLPAGEREENIACDLNDTTWFRRIDASGGAVFFAAGVFYYFLTEQVRALVQAMAEAFPGGRLVFDAANQKAVRLMLKTWIKTAEIQDVGAYFAVSDAKKELSAWSPRLRASSRGYMLGYQSLNDPSVPGFYRFLARVGDGMMRMQIVRLAFAEGETTL